MQEEEKLLLGSKEDKEEQLKAAITRRLKAVTLCMLTVKLHRDKSEAVLDKHIHARKLPPLAQQELMGLIERKKDSEEAKREDNWYDEVIDAPGKT